MPQKRKRKRIEGAQNSRMGRDFFKSLPSEMIVNILSRLPARTAMSCKCVCKLWLELLMTPEFVKSQLSHLSKAVPSLAVCDRESEEPYRIVEFVDELHINCDGYELDLNRDEDRWNVVFGFHPPFNKPVQSAVDGLLFLWKRSYRPGNLILCNPVTRDYILLPSPRETSSKPRLLLEIYGFGVSRLSGQYKLVRMFIESDQAIPHGVTLEQFECQVYTVGTGSWRRIASGSPLKYEESSVGAFVNGNLYWLAFELKSRTLRISCFDLETELISTFSPAPLDDSHKYRHLSVLGNCLCLCYNGADEIAIWLMKEYGDEKSWTKEFVIRKMDDTDGLGRYPYPVKVFEDGDILMMWGCLYYYSNKTKTIRVVYVSGTDCGILYSATIYTPSFLPLKTFAMENVGSF